MASLSSMELKKNIGFILKGADLASLSSKKVRKILEEKYGVDLTDRKPEIDEILMTMLTEENEKNDSGGSEKESSDAEDSQKDSIENSSDSEVKKEPPPKKSKPAPTKKLKKISIKKDSCSDRSADDSDVDDEALARKLQEEERNSRSRAVKKTSAKKERTKRAKKTEGEEKKPRKKGSYTKKCVLSSDLATVMGAEEMARHDVVKKMWEIVRERNLFDPRNKQFAICDEQLRKVFGLKRVRIFGMMKYLKNHIKDLE